MFVKKYVQMVGKLSFVCIVKKVAKGGVIHGMRQHLAGVKEDMSPCKLIPLDVRFQ